MLESYNQAVAYMDFINPALVSIYPYENYTYRRNDLEYHY